MNMTRNRKQGGESHEALVARHSVALEESLELASEILDRKEQGADPLPLEQEFLDQLLVVAKRLTGDMVQTPEGGALTPLEAEDHIKMLGVSLESGANAMAVKDEVIRSLDGALRRMTDAHWYAGQTYGADVQRALAFKATSPIAYVVDSITPPVLGLRRAGAKVDETMPPARGFSLKKEIPVGLIRRETACVLVTPIVFGQDDNEGIDRMVAPGEIGVAMNVDGEGDINVVFPSSGACLYYAPEALLEVVVNPPVANLEEAHAVCHQGLPHWTRRDDLLKGSEAPCNESQAVVLEAMVELHKTLQANYGTDYRLYSLPLGEGLRFEVMVTALRTAIVPPEAVTARDTWGSDEVSIFVPVYAGERAENILERAQMRIDLLNNKNVGFAEDKHDGTHVFQTTNGMCFARWDAVAGRPEITKAIPRAEAIAMVYDKRNWSPMPDQVITIEQACQPDSNH